MQAAKLAKCYSSESDTYMKSTADLMPALDVTEMCRQVPLCPSETRPSVSKSVPDVMRDFIHTANRILGRGDERILMITGMLLVPALTMVPAQKPGTTASKAAQLSRQATAFRNRRDAIQEHGWLAVYALIAHDYQLLAQAAPKRELPAGPDAAPTNAQLNRFAGLLQSHTSFKRAEEQVMSQPPTERAHEEFEKQSERPPGFIPFEFFEEISKPELTKFLKEHPAHDLPMDDGANPGGDWGDYRYAMLKLLRGVNGSASSCSNGAFPSTMRWWLTRSPTGAIHDEDRTWTSLCMLATLPESDNMFRVAHDIAHDAELPNMRTAQTLRWLNITRGVTVEKPHKPGHYRAIEVPSWFAILYFGLIHELHKPDVEKHNLVSVYINGAYVAMARAPPVLSAHAEWESSLQNCSATTVRFIPPGQG